jgi:hypothetical protein
MTHEDDVEKYNVMKVEVEEDDDDEATWDAADWCYIVRDGGDYVCICSSREEADRICKLLNADTF